MKGQWHWVKHWNTTQRWRLWDWEVSKKDIRKCTCNCSNKLYNLMTVTGNHVGLEGVKSLSEMLKVNTSLKTLGISGIILLFVVYSLLDVSFWCVTLIHRKRCWRCWSNRFVWGPQGQHHSQSTKRFLWVFHSFTWNPPMNHCFYGPFCVHSCQDWWWRMCENREDASE